MTEYEIAYWIIAAITFIFMKNIMKFSKLQFTEGNHYLGRLIFSATWPIIILLPLIGYMYKKGFYL